MTDSTASSHPDETPTEPTAPELEPLGGGIANAGAVFKRGSVVVRPAGPHSQAVQALMRRWRQAGIAEVPEPLGFETDAESAPTSELLRYVPGRVADPTDEWAVGLEAVIAVASVQKRLHDAASDFGPFDPDGPWGARGYIPEAFLAPGANPAIACHNDLCLSNIVFAEDRLDIAAVIDWDYAQPVDPYFDIAVAMRHWIPFSAPCDRPEAWADVDPKTRFGTWVEIAGLTVDAQQLVFDAAIAFLDRAHTNVADLARRGVGGFADLVAGGYLDRNRRDRQWIVANRTRL